MPEARSFTTAPREQLLQPAGAGDAATPSAAPATKPRPRWWRPVTRTLTVLFVLAVVVLLVMQARAVDWHNVLDAMSNMRAGHLAAAAGLTLVSFVVYSCYDLIGRAYTQHALTTPQVMTVGFISYAFNLNMGSLIGGIGFRYRLYSKLGLDNGMITRILVLSLVTNWMGYMCLAGVMFSARLLQVPDHWKVSTDTLQWIGFAFLVVVAAYLGLCAFARRRGYTIRGQEMHLPSLRMALLQLALSMSNWLLMGGVAWLLLAQQVPFVTVFCVLMVSSVAGILTHIPANLGVLEAVFVALLASQLSKGDVLAAVLAYRATYYLAPLVVAAIVYAVTEASTRKKAIGSGP